MTSPQLLHPADKDLGAQTLVEPSCGTGAFLLPIVERLVASSAAHSRDLRTLGSAISAFDLLDANARLARKAVAQLLIEHGLDDEEAGLGSIYTEGSALAGPAARGATRTPAAVLVSDRGGAFVVGRLFAVRRRGTDARAAGLIHPRPPASRDRGATYLRAR